MMWSFVDAVNLAIDEARNNPTVDVDKLANEIWQDMQAMNAELA